MKLDIGDHWIEMRSFRDERARTQWIVKIGSEILKIGEVADDPTGSLGFEAAAAWADANVPGSDFQWKHSSATNDR